MAAEWKETLETEREISAFMLELGIPAHLRGYYYLREAVLLAVSDMELVGSVTKLLYPVIARRYKQRFSGWNARSETRWRCPGNGAIRRCLRICSGSAGRRARRGRQTANT